MRTKVFDQMPRDWTSMYPSIHRDSNRQLTFIYQRFYQQVYTSKVNYLAKIEHKIRERLKKHM